MHSTKHGMNLLAVLCAVENWVYDYSFVSASTPTGVATFSSLCATSAVGSGACAGSVTAAVGSGACAGSAASAACATSATASGDSAVGATSLEAPAGSGVASVGFLFGGNPCMAGSLYCGSCNS